MSSGESRRKLRRCSGRRNTRAELRFCPLTGMRWTWLWFWFWIGGEEFAWVCGTRRRRGFHDDDETRDGAVNVAAEIVHGRHDF
ncbi:hypothetical protein Bca52824_062597 [Brassica carinata]|uniref:Uncharacterized protein n=1 Tax=Brassica carinata TaxID=52824 RepID=A0A8X7QD66_BRACI|nr:hypothetical protein Bca52824_062597 [Brassica carinata]